jgi:glycosyltransferase involved in cell wall biosynthesis
MGPDRRLRIAFVTETFPPEIGGAAMSAARFVEALLARGHRVQLVRPRQRAERRAPEASGLTQVLVPGVPVPFHGGLQLGLPAAGTLATLWSRERPHVVHLVSEGLLGRSARRVARRLGLPLTSSFHTNFPSYGRHYGFGCLAPIAMRYLRAFHAAAGVTMVPTRQVYDQLTAAGFRHLAVVGRGVDTASFDPGRRSDALRRSWGAGPADLVALVVGRLAPEKSVPLAVRAYRAMAEARPGTRLVVVGDGPERPRLQAALPEATFTGMLRGDALAAHYASADVFLFPSLTETFGNVTLEAMASGLAVVAYDDAAAAQHIRPFASGLLAPRGDAAELVAHARRLAQQPDLIRRLGPAARQAVASVSWDAVGAAFTGLLEEQAARAEAGRAASSPSRVPAGGAAAPADGRRGAAGRASGYVRS